MSGHSSPGTGPPVPDGDGLRRIAALVVEAALAVIALVSTVRRSR